MYEYYVRFLVEDKTNDVFEIDTDVRVKANSLDEAIKKVVEYTDVDRSNIIEVHKVFDQEASD